MSVRGLTPRLAWRYLRAPKSYSAVSAISIVAVTGVAVATAAIICVLSVFNGFRSILNNRLDSLAPDVVVTPATGKVFNDGDSLSMVIQNIAGVEEAMPSVSDNALVIAQSREMPVRLKGVVPQVYSRITSLDSIIFEGSSLSKEPEAKDAVISVGVASQLGIYNSGGDMLLFTPKRQGRINTANPMSSFMSDSVYVGGIFQAYQSEYDENTIITDIQRARDLFQYTTEATSIDIKAKPGVNIGKLAADISDILGSGYVVKDRIQQQEINFRMIEIEKWVTFLLLVFILIIASFNIISTMCMLVVEKESSLSILSALGMKKGSIGSTFWWESIYVSLGGGIAGIIIGVILCLLQQHFGFIKLNGNPETLTVSSYPVVVEWIDILWAMIPVIVIGLITAWITSAFTRSRI